MATAFSRAGVDELTAVFILGHKGGKSMSYGYYAKADELHRLKDTVEAASTIIKRDRLKRQEAQQHKPRTAKIIHKKSLGINITNPGVDLACFEAHYTH
jgi:hypothetical protein